jgi:hypothetical protein
MNRIRRRVLIGVFTAGLFGGIVYAVAFHVGRHANIIESIAIGVIFGGGYVISGTVISLIRWRRLMR